MDKYINKQQAIDAICIEWCVRENIDCEHRFDEYFYCDGCTDVEALKKLPSVDAVEVVLCKDCKYRDPEDKSCDCGHDIIWQLPRDDNWFCADGKRMSDDPSHPFADDVMMG